MYQLEFMLYYIAWGCAGNLGAFVYDPFKAEGKQRISVLQEQMQLMGGLPSSIETRAAHVRGPVPIIGSGEAPALTDSDDDVECLSDKLCVRAWGRSPPISRETADASSTSSQITSVVSEKRAMMPLHLPPL